MKPVFLNKLQSKTISNSLGFTSKSLQKDSVKFNNSPKALEVHFSGKSQPPNPKLIWTFIGTLALGSGYWGYQKLNPPAPKPDASLAGTPDDPVPDQADAYLATVDDVLTKVKLGKIEKVQILTSTPPIYIFTMTQKDKNGDSQKMYFYRPSADQEVARLEAGLREKNIHTTKFKPSGDLTFLLGFIPTFILIALIVLMLRKSGVLGKLGSIKTDSTTSEVRFADVRGYPWVIKDLEKIVKQIRNYTQNKVGAKLPKGILLTGPPGTGKTLIARAIAGEANVPFLALGGSEFVQVFAGLGAMQVRRVFDQAEKLAAEKGGCIIFIDELDAIGRKRSASGISDGGTKEGEQTLNQLLIRLDGFKERGLNIMVIGATNRPDVLDEALKRPGRFGDQEIHIDLPVAAWQRKDILESHLKDKVKDGLLAADVSIDQIAENTPGFSGADLANLTNKAALNAFLRDKEKIEMADFREAIDQVSLGVAKDSLVTNKDRKIIAYHEVAGHGLTALAAKMGLDSVSMIARGKSLGHVRLAQGEMSEVLRSKNELLKMLLYTIGGRAAEKVLLPPGDFTTGAKNDLQQIRQILLEMLQSAMFEGHAAMGYEEKDRQLGLKLLSKDEALMNQVIDEALKTAEAIIRIVPREKVDALITEALDAKSDFKREEAHALYARHLGQNFDWNPLYQLVEQFLQHPTGKNSTTEATVV